MKKDTTVKLKKDTTVRVDAEIAEKLDEWIEIDPYFENRSQLVRFILRNALKIGKKKEIIYQEGTKLFKKVSYVKNAH